MKKKMKLSQWAKKNDVSYRTAQRYWYDGKLKGEQTYTGTILIFDDEEEKIDKGKNEGVVIYTRVSSSQNKNNLEGQAKRVEEYCMAKGYKINGIIKEIGSGLNDGRKQLANLLEKGKCGRIVVEHKDRLTRFGFKYIEMLCKEKGIKVEIINEVDTDRDSLMQDFVSLVTSFCSRLYGQRRNKRKTEQLIEALKNNSEEKKIK